MSFTQKLQGLVSKAEKKWGERNGGQPPPIPFASKPQSAYPAAGSSHTQSQQQTYNTQQPQIYWQPSFDPRLPVATNFQHEQGQHGWGNNEAQNYTDSPSNSFHAANGSALVLHALIDSTNHDPSQRFTSARLSSHQTLARQRGCLSAVITAPVAEGIWPAFWLLPNEPFTWPTDGEVDIMEAWNGDAMNHSCLHWGFFNGADHDKHRVLETPIPNINRSEGMRFDFLWDVNDGSGQGRLLWLINGRPAMRAMKPPGTRPMRDFRILINIAVGGNVCQGQMPKDGTYEAVIKDLAMWDAPPGGWGQFERAWSEAREGHTM